MLFYLFLLCLIHIDFEHLTFIAFRYFLWIYREDRHVALTVRSAVNATWRGKIGSGPTDQATGEYRSEWNGWRNLSDKWKGSAFKDQAHQRQLQRNVTCRKYAKSNLYVTEVLLFWICVIVCMILFWTHFQRFPHSCRPPKGSTR